MSEERTPTTIAEAAEALRSCGDDGTPVRFLGGGTKAGWGAASAPAAVIRTTRLSGVLEHNSGDLTAIVEAGTPLAEAQEVFAAAGQMVALDPAPSDGATIGGVLATADSGPLRHRYGAPRDLVLGMTVVLSDGTVARSGGKVIKNVAGYDIAKLFCGSFGTLGLIARVALRLHPLPATTATARARSAEPAALQEAALAITHSSLEAMCVDVTWNEGTGAVLARFGGATAGAQARRAAEAMAADAEVVEDDDALWAEQRARQRSSGGVVLRTSLLQSEWASVLRAAARAGASLVGRAAGVAWISLPPGEADATVAAIEELRRGLARPSTILDAPDTVGAKPAVWDVPDGPTVELMRRLKARFDPPGICAAGTFVGGI